MSWKSLPCQCGALSDLRAIPVLLIPPLSCRKDRLMFPTCRHNRSGYESFLQRSLCVFSSFSPIPDLRSDILIYDISHIQKWRCTNLTLSSTHSSGHSPEESLTLPPEQHNSAPFHSQASQFASGNPPFTPPSPLTNHGISLNMALHVLPRFNQMMLSEDRFLDRGRLGMMSLVA
jgi:hypothetical protein